LRGRTSSGDASTRKKNCNCLIVKLNSCEQNERSNIGKEFPSPKIDIDKERLSPSHFLLFFKKKLQEGQTIIEVQRTAKSIKRMVEENSNELHCTSEFYLT